MCYTHCCIISGKQHKIVISPFLMGIFSFLSYMQLCKTGQTRTQNTVKMRFGQYRPTSPQIADGKCRATPRKNTVNWEPFPVDFA